MPSRPHATPIRLSAMAAFLLLLAVPMPPARGGDGKAREAFEEALAAAREGRWSRAARRYLDAELMADDVVRKANALKQAARAYRKAEDYYKEYSCLKKLVEVYPEHVDVPKAVRREYEIGNLYLAGYRDTIVKWLPWVEEKDRSMEIFESVLKQAPYADFVPRMLLRMASMHLLSGENEKAEAIYKDFLKTRGDAPLAEVAYLELANIQLELAKVGDGDGAYCDGARKTLREFIARYPGSPEVAWAKDGLRQADEIAAERVFSLARFYKKEGNKEAATRYARDVIVNFPETKAAPQAEALLAEMDKEYLPPYRPEAKPVSKYTIKPLPEEEEPVLTAPKDSGGKWLLPVTDMGLDTQRADLERLKAGIEKPIDIPEKEF